METRRIGSLDVTLVGLGCNNFGGRLDEQRSVAVIDAALEAGITLFDTADVYGGTQSEEILGRALRGRRDHVVIATKFGLALDDERKGASPAYVRRAVEDSLRRLQTDWIDLFQLHRPDPATPIGETLAALDDLVRSGKVRELGCSNVSGTQLGEAEAAARPGAARFVCVQNEYSLLVRDAERGVLPEVRARGLAFLPYFPLASGVLSGKYRRGAPAPAGTRLAGADSRLGERFLTDANLEVVETLSIYAARRGHTLLELAFSWLAAQSSVSSIIAGATTPAQVRANVAAPTWQLNTGELRALDEIVWPRAV
jgi:aryl-alcohol dehydrogenase-like predicted oxidoreductase